MNKVEEYSIAIINLLIFVFSLIYLFGGFNGITFINLDKFYRDLLPTFLDSNEGTLVSLASILIGIYFTIFTLLGTVRIESTIGLLSDVNFKQLVKYIKNAFVYTFLYIIFLLIVPNPQKHQLPLMIYIVNLLFLIYMLASAIRFAIIMFISFKNDIEQFEDLKKAEIIKREEHEQLIFKVNQFLSDHNEIKNQKYSEQISKKINDK